MNYIIPPLSGRDSPVRGDSQPHAERAIASTRAWRVFNDHGNAIAILAKSGTIIRFHQAVSRLDYLAESVGQVHHGRRSGLFCVSLHLETIIDFLSRNELYNAK